MLVILLVISLLVFFFVFVFMKASVKKNTLAIISLIIMIFSQFFLVLNEVNYFGMYQKQIVIKEDLISKNKSISFTKETVVPVYLYQIKGNEEANTKVNDKVVVKHNATKAQVEMVNQELFFKNNFYEFLFYFVRSNGDIIKSDINFNLPSDWHISESAMLK